MSASARGIPGPSVCRPGDASIFRCSGAGGSVPPRLARPWPADQRAQTRGDVGSSGKGKKKRKKRKRNLFLYKCNFIPHGHLDAGAGGRRAPGFASRPSGPRRRPSPPCEPRGSEKLHVSVSKYIQCSLVPTQCSLVPCGALLFGAGSRGAWGAGGLRPAPPPGSSMEGGLALPAGSTAAWVGTGPVPGLSGRGHSQ